MWSAGSSQRSTRASPSPILAGHWAAAPGTFPGCGSLTAALFPLLLSLRMALLPNAVQSKVQELQSVPRAHPEIDVEFWCRGTLEGLYGWLTRLLSARATIGT
jgi:hypothetical protein